MARWVIGLSVGLLLGMPVAHAAPVSEGCGCGTLDVVLPRLGATGVPRNAKIWAVGRGYAGTSTVELRPGSGTVASDEDGGELRSVTRYSIPELDPERAYTVEPHRYGPMTRFTTGPSFDHVAPAVPQIRSAGIAITPARDANAGELGEFQLDAGFDPDAALVKIEIRGAGAPITIVTVPGDWQWIGKPACDTQLRLQPGERVSLVVTAIDLAGNESAPATQQIVVARGSSPPGSCAQRRFRGPCVGPLIYFIYLPQFTLVFVVLVIFVKLAGRYASRKRAAGSAIPEPLSSLAAEHLTRSRQVGAGIVAVLGFAGIPVLVAHAGHGDLLAIASAIVASVSARRLLVARACLAMIESGRAEVVSQAHRLVVKLGDAEAAIDLSEARIARARRRHALATSIVRTRS